MCHKLSVAPLRAKREGLAAVRGYIFGGLPHTGSVTDGVATVPVPTAVLCMECE